MPKIQMRSLIRFLLCFWMLHTAVAWVLPPQAEARIGGGRSSGRSSGFRRSPPPSRPQYDAQRSSPNHQPAAPNGRGGFLRGIAGGLAGGFLGSMLFSSLGHGMGHGGFGGGGIGLLEILLLAGLGFLLLRWWKNRQQVAPAAASQHSDFPGTTHRSHEGASSWASEPDQRSDADYFRPQANSFSKTMDREEASDYFFRIQGAWTRRDLSGVKGLLNEDMTAILERDLSELRGKQHINRLENIAIRDTEISQPWSEFGEHFVTVRYSASLLDYTVDEKTGSLVDGSDTLPVKFAEDWTFRCPSAAASWQLVGIEQVNS